MYYSLFQMVPSCRPFFSMYVCAGTNSVLQFLVSKRRDTCSCGHCVRTTGGGARYTRSVCVRPSLSLSLSLPLSKDLYDEYVQHTKKTWKRELVGVDGALCSRDYFYKTWSDAFPTLKLKPQGDFMKCQKCVLLAGSIYGSTPGVRGVEDQAETELHRAEYNDHLKVTYCTRHAW